MTTQAEAAAMGLSDFAEICSSPSLKGTKERLRNKLQHRKVDDTAAGDSPASAAAAHDDGRNLDQLVADIEDPASVADCRQRGARGQRKKKR